MDAPEQFKLCWEQGFVFRDSIPVSRGRVRDFADCFRGEVHHREKVKA